MYKAYNVVSNPLDALGHYNKYGYIQQGNQGNYGLRDDASPMGAAVNAANPFAWLNAGIRLQDDLGKPETYTTWSGAGNALMDALEMLPMFTETRPLAGAAMLADDAARAGKYINNKYANIAEGANPFDYAWRSPAARFDDAAIAYDEMEDVLMPLSQKHFDDIRSKLNLTDQENKILKEYEYDSRAFTGRGSETIDKNKRAILDSILERAEIETSNPLVMSRRINASDPELFKRVGNKIVFDRPTSWSAGRDALGNNVRAERSPDRIVTKLPSGKNKVLKNPYEALTNAQLEEYKQSLRAKGYSEDNVETYANMFNTPRVSERELLLGANSQFKQIGKVKNKIGGYDYIVKPINTKASKTLPGSPNAMSSSKIVWPQRNSKNLLPELEPYLGQTTKPLSQEEQIFRSFLSPEERAKLEAADIIKYNPDGSVKTTDNYNMILEGIKQNFRNFNPSNLKTDSAVDWMNKWYSHPDFKRRYTTPLYKTDDTIDPYLAEYMQDYFLSSLAEYEPKNYFNLLKDRGLGAYLQNSLTTAGLSYGKPEGIYVNRTQFAPFNRKGIESTRAHELTHLIEQNGVHLRPADEKALLEPFGYSNRNEVPYKSGIFSQLTGDNPQYFLDPTEIHARMNEARFNLGLSPDDVFTTEMFDKIAKTYNWYGMGRYIKDKKKFVDLMNNFWAVPAVIGTGAAGAAMVGSDTPQYKYGGWLQKYQDGSQVGPRIENLPPTPTVIAEAQRQKVEKTKQGNRDQWGRPYNDTWYGFDPSTKQFTVRDAWGRAPQDDWYGFDPYTRTWSKGSAGDKTREYAKYDESLKYTNDYLKSPMYKEMLQQSVDSPSDFDYFADSRAWNLANIPPLQILPRPEARPFTGATSSNRTGQVTLYPEGFGSEGTFAHELSHSTDRPSNFFTTDRLIPKKDQEYIINNKAKSFKESRAYLEDKEYYDTHYTPEELLNIETDFNSFYRDYVGEPTEVRARLNAIRKGAKDNDFYDPFNEKIDFDIYYNLLKYFDFEKNRDLNPMQQLQEIFTDDEIIHMLNSISENKPSKTDNLSYGKYGGWLQKYQTAGPVKPTSNFTLPSLDPQAQQAADYNKGWEAYNAGVRRWTELLQEKEEKKGRPLTTEEKQRWLQKAVKRNDGRKTTVDPNDPKWNFLFKDSYQTWDPEFGPMTVMNKPIEVTAERTELDKELARIAAETRQAEISNPFNKSLGDTAEFSPARMKRASQNANDQVALRILNQKPQGDRNRVEWLNTLTPQERSIIERSQYAGKLNPDYSSQFSQGFEKLLRNTENALANSFSPVQFVNDKPYWVNSDYTPEEAANASAWGVLAPLHYPTNLVTGALTGDFGSALQGQTSMPLFTDYRQPGFAAAMSGLYEGLYDPFNAVGVGLLKGTNIAGNAARAGKYLTTKTPLKNAYNLRPSVLKENPEMYLYRARPVGQNVDMNMAAQLRAKEAAGEPLTWYQRNLLNPQTNAQMLAREKYFGRFFEKDPNRLDWYINPETRNFADNEAIEILRTKLPKLEAAKLNVSQFDDAKVLSSSPETEFILPKNMVNSAERFPESSWQQLIQEDKVFNTPHWWRGYGSKTPKQLPGSSNVDDIVRLESEIATLKNQEIANENIRKNLWADYKAGKITGEDYKFKVNKLFESQGGWDNTRFNLEKQLRELKVKNDIANTPQQNILQSESQLGKNISTGGSQSKGVFELGDDYVARLSAYGYDNASRLVNYQDKITSPRVAKTLQVKEIDGKVYQVQQKATGKPLDQLSQEELSNIPKEHINNFWKDKAELDNLGLNIDVSGGKSNIFYHPLRKFSFLVLSS